MMHTILTAKKRKIQYRWSFKHFAKNMLLLLVVSGLATILVTTAVKATFNNPSQTVEIRVMQGDTLWSIAQKLEPSTDPRLVIHRIKEYNRLTVSSLEIGQSLAYQVSK